MSIGRNIAWPSGKIVGSNPTPATNQDTRSQRSVGVQALAETEAGLHAYTTADLKTFLQGRRIIEPFHKAYDFMTLEENNLKKAELPKLVLWKLSLANGTFEFSYKNPFNVLLDLTTLPGWWRRRDIGSEIVLQFSPAFKRFALELLGP